MKNSPTIAVSAVVAAAIAGGTGYWFAMQKMKASDGQAAAAPGAAAPGKKVLYWHDPMYPQQKFDKPGKSPYMDMMLVPVYGDEGGDDSSVKISPRVMQNLGIRMAEARLGALEKKVEAVGAVAFDERSVVVVQARVGGFVEKLYARAPLDPVAQGQPLVDILAPDWVAAQEEYLALRRSANADEALRSAARQRLVLLGMPAETIAALEADGKARPRITLTAPVSGVIGELGAREGMTVMPGAMLFRINGLATVWVNAEVPERETSWIKPGAAVEATVPAYPGQKFSGHIAAVLPEVNPATRTLKARIEIANPQARLKPGMYATVNLAPQERHQALLVPSEAVIRTGQRSVVVIADPGPEGRQQFRTVDVDVGTESGGQSEILKGVHPGEKVVVSGQFLIDSEASLKATSTRLAEAAAGTVHHGEGRLERVDKAEVTISHGPIPSLDWGPMTMDFATPNGVPPELKPGDMVGFDFRQTPQGEFEVVSIAPAKEGKP